jgi:hypothetical protein
VNAYTRILQRYFDEHGKEEVIVNSIHPGSFHSKISQVVLVASYIERTNTKSLGMDRYSFEVAFLLCT